jgi:putative membrane protein
MKIVIVYLFILCSAFFPAYLWYQPEHAWVGYIFTIGFALSCYIPFLKDYQRAWWIGLVGVVVFGYIIESIGVLTCFPYGCFWYSEQLGIKLFDIVPLMLAFTRPPLVLWIWSYVKNIFWHWWKMWLAGWIGLVFIDLILDPIAVMIWLWSYPGWGFWFGVPLSNFAGRMLSGTISMIILDYSVRNTYTKKLYMHGLWMTMTFFVWYALWKFIILVY